MEQNDMQNGEQETGDQAWERLLSSELSKQTVPLIAKDLQDMVDRGALGEPFDPKRTASDASGTQA